MRVVWNVSSVEFFDVSRLEFALNVFTGFVFLYWNREHKKEGFGRESLCFYIDCEPLVLNDICFVLYTQYLDLNST